MIYIKCTKGELDAVMFQEYTVFYEFRIEWKLIGWYRPDDESISSSIKLMKRLRLDLENISYDYVEHVWLWKMSKETFERLYLGKQDYFHGEWGIQIDEIEIRKLFNKNR